MNRIYITLSWFALLLVAANLLIGLSLGDLRPGASDDVLAWARVHRLLGVAAALAVVLVKSIIITYFIGTSRWCKEVVETYNLDRALAAQAAAIKRRAFPWALASMLAIVGVVALGGAADPATGRATAQQWASTHLITALAAMCLIAWASFQEWNQVCAQIDLIGQVMAEVRRVRLARGLEVN